MKYSIDTSALLDSWRRSYPPSNFPLFWRKIEELIQNGQIIVTEEVMIELEKKDDEIYAWAKERSEMVIPIDDKIQIEVSKILKKFPRLLDTRKNRSGADPFVIALAIREKCVVITNENGTNSEKRPHIPDVCAAFGIKTMNVLQFIQEMGWIFKG